MARSISVCGIGVRGRGKWERLAFGRPPAAYLGMVYWMSSGSYLERSFALWMRSTDLPAPAREHRFAPPRRWRFDFAWPDQKVAVEIDGLVHGGRGRHQTVSGLLAEAEKYETALRLGWRVYRIPGQWVANRQRHIWRPQVVSTLELLLNPGI